MEKYKIGDKVRIIKNDSDIDILFDMFINKVGIIIRKTPTRWRPNNDDPTFSNFMIEFSDGSQSIFNADEFVKCNRLNKLKRILKNN